MRWKTYLLSGVILLVAAAAILFLRPADTLTGFFSFVEVAPPGFEFKPPGEVSEKIASQAIQDAQIEIAGMKQRNFTMIFVHDVLQESKVQYEQGNYTGVLEMTELISFIHKKKVEFLDQVELTKSKEQKYQKQKVDTRAGQALMAQALAAFAQDQLVDAQKLLQQVETSLENSKAEKERQKSLAYLSKNFILKYWWQMVLVIAVLSIISPLLTKNIIKKKRQQKLAGLKSELEKIRELIKRLQKTCFVDKKMSSSSYRQKAAQYEERMAEIKHTIPVIEAQLQGKKDLSTKPKPIGIIEVKR